MTEKFEFSGGETIEMWTTRRLPYCDRQTLGEKVAIKELRDALQKFPEVPSTILSARYTSSNEGYFDVENVLAYNIGMSAFRRSGQGGIMFERVRAAPPAAPSGLLFDHHHAYKQVAPPSRPTNGTTVTFDLPSTFSIENVWWAVAGSQPVTCLPISDLFSLHVEVRFEGRSSLMNSVKVLLDGIVAGLQTDPAPNIEAVRRLSQKMSLPEDLITARLVSPSNAALGSRPKLLCVRGSSVQWNPGDEKCELVAVVAKGLPGTCVVTVTDLS